MSEKFNVVIVAQRGRLTYEAVLFLASLRCFSPDFPGQIIVAEPNHSGRWRDDPTMDDAAAKSLITDHLGAEVRSFSANHFGQDYPYGNKIEALGVAPKSEPFVFFDTDTLITGDLGRLQLDFSRPSASERVCGTWPEPQLYGAGYSQIWRSLYDRFGLDFESSLDPDYPDEFWRHYLYFNAGWFYGACPQEFGARFLSFAKDIRDDPGPALAAQSLDPWLDQIALPLVIHSFGGGRGLVPADSLDGTMSCHYRNMPLLFARENDHVIAALQQAASPNKVKKVLKSYEPMKRFIYQNRGQKVRDMFDRKNLPQREKVIRNMIKKAGHWMR